MMKKTYLKGAIVNTITNSSRRQLKATHFLRRRRQHLWKICLRAFKNYVDKKSSFAFLPFASLHISVMKNVEFLSVAGKNHILHQNEFPKEIF